MKHPARRPRPVARRPLRWLALVLGLLPVTVPTPLGAQALISWGENDEGQVGDGASAVSRPPSPYTHINDAMQSACGRAWCMARRSNGTVQSWGTNYSGALGRPGAGSNALPGEIVGLSDIVAIAAGTFHGLALTSTGFVYGWGYNGYGQLGDGSVADRPSPSITATFPANVRAVGAGESHSVVLLADGTVWTVGNNALGQLGRATTGTWSAMPGPVAGLNSVVQIAVGLSSNLALKSDGTVWGWGLNAQGVLGDGTTTDAPTPVQVSGLTDVALIALGFHNGFALKSDGTVWGWGTNSSLGHGVAAGTSTTPQLIPSLTGVSQIRAGDGGYSMALLDDGTLRVWGSNDATNVFNDATQTQSFVPIPVPGLAGVSGIDLGYRTALARGTVVGECEVFIYSARLSTDGNDHVVLDFQDPTNRSTAITHTVYRSSDAALPLTEWPLVASNVLDMDPVAPNLQWIEQSNDVSPSGIWYYKIAPDDVNCRGTTCTPGAPGCGWVNGDMVSYGQESWGDPQHPAGVLLQTLFDALYPSGVEVGIPGPGGFSAIFTSAGAVLDYLPASGGNGPLNTDVLDPTSTASGSFGGFVLALQLDVDLSDAGWLAGSAGIPFGDVRLCGVAAPFDGLTVRQVLGLANQTLGGGGLVGYTIDDIALLANDLALAFEGGTPSAFAQQQLVNGVCTPNWQVGEVVTYSAESWGGDPMTSPAAAPDLSAGLGGRRRARRRQ